MPACCKPAAAAWRVRGGPGVRAKLGAASPAPWPRAAPRGVGAWSLPWLGSGWAGHPPGERPHSGGVHGRGPLALAASPRPDRGLAPAVDCWDGPDGEPIVHHGYTLTSKILFKDVIETINKYAFVKNE